MAGKPIPWESVAMVGFQDGRAVIITSVEPHVLFDTVCSLLDEHEDEAPYYYVDEKAFRGDVQISIANLEWRLYAVEDAKEIFCRKHHTEGGPLPNQQSLPFS